MAWQRIDGNGGKTEAVDYINFNTPGQEIEGTYLAAEYEENIEFPNMVHSIRQANGRKASFFDCWDLNRKLKKVKKGERVKIKFLGGGELMADGTRSRKLFDVQVDRK